MYLGSLGLPWHMAFLLTVVLLGICVSCAFSKILGTFALPHGGIALDPSHFHPANKSDKILAEKIHAACETVGEMLETLRPDTVLLSTPHGIADQENFILYFNKKGSGYADTDNCVCPPCCYNVSVNFDVSLTHSLYEHLKDTYKVSTLSAFGPPGESTEYFPLRWGEVIPMHFMKLLNRTNFVVLSQPSRRYSEEVKMIPELLHLGGELWQMLEASDKRIAVVISADLAHTHSPDGPYGYSNASQPFDTAVGRWVQSMDGDYLLDVASKLVDQALSCGYTGLVMLHGLLTASTLSWKSTLHVIGHPSYYGMMVASFIPASYF